MGVVEILGIIGLIIGIIVASRTKKPGVSSLLISLGLYFSFGPALFVITEVLTISNIAIFGWINTLVVNFALGALITYVFRMLSELR